ncbi:SixA phosphatase family protein [Rhodoligotrophos appendicifer]|nr:histidine phosphatase family protein [Rhodoligotrophos appendicifer]
MLLRHAKSSWADAPLSDRDRPLTGRGREAAVTMGLFMTGLRPLPSLILCSPAMRARETCELSRRAFPSPVDVQVVEELYDFGDGSAIIGVVRAQEDVSPILVIGHNPSMEEAALKLVGAEQSHMRDRIANKYPTAALTVIDFDARSWKEIVLGSGQLISFTTPRDLGA